MSQDHNHSNPATWECKYHVVFTPKYRKKLLFGQIQYSTNWPGAQAQGMQDRRGTTPDARPCAYADLDPAKIFGGGGDRISEREELDLGSAERGTQAAQFSWPQILGEGLLRFDRRAGRGDDPHLHQKSGWRTSSWISCN